MEAGDTAGLETCATHSRHIRAKQIHPPTGTGTAAPPLPSPGMRWGRRNLAPFGGRPPLALRLLAKPSAIQTDSRGRPGLSKAPGKSMGDPLHEILPRIARISRIHEFLSKLFGITTRISLNRRHGIHRCQMACAPKPQFRCSQRLCALRRSPSGSPARIPDISLEIDLSRPGASPADEAPAFGASSNKDEHYCSNTDFGSIRLD